jgi:hypothetical protein
MTIKSELFLIAATAASLIIARMLEGADLGTIAGWLVASLSP